MIIVKGRRCGKTVQIEEMPAGEFVLYPPAPNVCQECARAHAPELPHDKQSLYYQTKFHLKHDRGATWTDAMAHCTDEIKAAWSAALRERGIEVDG